MQLTNDPDLNSWIEIPEGSDFPIQNLPFGIFKTDYLPPGAGVAIGDYVIDLVFLYEHGFLDGLDLPAGVFNQKFLNQFLSLGRSKCGKVRERISELLRVENKELQSNLQASEIALIHKSEVEMLLPVQIPNYTDFYSSQEHATNVGSMFRDPSNALLPNWKHLPVAYHGRPSSIVVSGTPLHRPKGQIKPSDGPPFFGPTQKLDFELELAFVICTDTLLGSSISVEEAEENIFGFVLFNDWSARDIQQWEYAPLGPFLGKNFGSTISPWIVTMEALEPFRISGPEQQPRVLPYLTFNGEKNFDLSLEVLIRPENSTSAFTICNSNSKYLYWNVNQQLAHHTVNGCNVQVGDICASGTISGPSPESFGSLLELTWNGQKPLQLGERIQRRFVEDGDTIIMKGFAKRNGVRIGFGECSGKILPAEK
jgi:fumarylacetoacetase